jgi:UDP-GlcNAc:undecaprenyl-phosphate GlcNAc-1-phosphate transferase
VSLPSGLVLAGAAGLGALGTWLVRTATWRMGLVRQPNPIVPQHRRPIAHFGGLAIYGAAAAVLAAARMAGTGGLEGVDRIALPATAFLLLGVIDDIHRLSALPKFVLQLACAALAVSSGVVLPVTGVAIVDGAASAVFTVLVVNAFNLIDVCDGLASGLALVLLLCLAIGNPDVAVPALIVAGGCAGFLFFNFPPATIFLGDTGSQLLGFVAAALLLDGGRAAPPWPYAAQVMLFVGVPLFEVVFLVVVRGRKRLPFWRGSPDHFALRLQAAGLSQLQTDLVAWGAAALLGIAALALPHLSLPVQLALLLGVVTTLVACGALLLRWEVVPS